MLQQLIIQIHDRPEGNPLKVSLTGQLRGTDALRLKTTVSQLMDGEHSDLEIDLTEVSDIDLKGINSLAFIYKMQQLKGLRSSFIYSQSNQLMHIIRPTKMHRILPFRNAGMLIAS